MTAAKYPLASTAFRSSTPNEFVSKEMRQRGQQERAELALGTIGA